MSSLALFVRRTTIFNIIMRRLSYNLTRNGQNVKRPLQDANAIFFNNGGKKRVWVKNRRNSMSEAILSMRTFQDWWQF